MAKRIDHQHAFDDTIQGSIGWWNGDYTFANVYFIRMDSPNDRLTDDGKPKIIAEVAVSELEAVHIVADKYKVHKKYLNVMHTSPKIPYELDYHQNMLNTFAEAYEYAFGDGIQAEHDLFDYFDMGILAYVYWRHGDF